MVNDSFAWLVATATAASLNSLQSGRRETSEDRNALKRILRLFDLGPSHRRRPGCIKSAEYRIMTTRGTLIQRRERQVECEGAAMKANDTFDYPLDISFTDGQEKNEVLWQWPQCISAK